MYKKTLILSTFALTLTGFAVYKFANGSTPESRCQVRMKKLQELIKNNKEVSTIFEGFIGSAITLHPEVDPSEVARAIAQALIQQCIAEEKTRYEV
jgi:hypothetical protein